MRQLVLGFLASLAVAANDYRSAEGYLLEMLSWCAFAERPPGSVIN